MISVTWKVDSDGRVTVSDEVASADDRRIDGDLIEGDGGVSIGDEKHLAVRDSRTAVHSIAASHPNLN